MPDISFVSSESLAHSLQVIPLWSIADSVNVIPTSPLATLLDLLTCLKSLISNLVECIFCFLYKKVTWNPFCNSWAVHGNSFISATKTVPHLVKGHDWKQQSTKSWKQPQTEFPILLSDGLHEPQRDKYHVHILPPVAVCWIILMNHIKFLDNICHLPKLQFSAVKDQPVHLFRYL